VYTEHTSDVAGIEFFLDDRVVTAITDGLKKGPGARTPSEHDSIAKLLGSVPIFKRLKAPQLRELSAHLAYEHFEQGDVVLYEGDAGENFYIVLSVRHAMLSDDNLCVHT
jgi:hypothetical protein